MSTKDWKNKEIGRPSMAESWDFKIRSLQNLNEFNRSGELQGEAFAGRIIDCSSPW